MNKDICIITYYRRPEYLQHCINNIINADRAEELFYCFAFDYGYDPKGLEIVKEFPFEYGIIEMKDNHYKLGKQSANVLNSLIVSAEETKEFVFYVEDDIFIGKDFFNWHYEMIKQFDYPLTIGTMNQNGYVVPGDLNNFYTVMGRDFQSWGYCTTKEFILEKIKPHYNSQYLNNPDAYIWKHFPNSFLGRAFTEQDGLIRRIIEKEQIEVPFPSIPRAFHAGIWGYHRHNDLVNKSFEEKFRIIDKLYVPLGTELLKYNLYDHIKPEYDLYKDIHPVDLTLTYKGNYAKV